MRVLGCGELLWDMLPDGRALGGAPFNVTAHLALLGHETAYLTAVGRDEPGDAAARAVAALGVSTAFVQRVDGLPTGHAGVDIAADGSPAFVIARDVAYEAVAVDDSLLSEMVAFRPDCLVFGTLAQEAPGMLTATKQLCAALPDSLAVYDLNLRAGRGTPALVATLAERANVVKLNEAEAGILADLHGLTWPGREGFARDVAGRFGLRGVAITRGSEPASLLLDAQYVEAPPPRVAVFDSVGAGDAFTAGLVDAILRSEPASVALRRANALGALVAASRGAVPRWSRADLQRLEAATAAATGGARDE